MLILTVIACVCSVVEFANSKDMKHAIAKYDGYELYGRKIHVFVDRERHR